MTRWGQGGVGTVIEAYPKERKDRMELTRVDGRLQWMTSQAKATRDWSSCRALVTLRSSSMAASLSWMTLR
eukprot:g17127.t1